MKYVGFDDDESTWEPIENLLDSMDLVTEFMSKRQQKEKGKNIKGHAVRTYDLSFVNLRLVLDQIIGCGQRNGNKFFLVRFRNSHCNEIIDWETAKTYSVQVMEFFGSRTVWTQMKNIIDSDLYNDQENAVQQTATNTANTTDATPSTSQLDSCINEIEFEK